MRLLVFTSLDVAASVLHAFTVQKWWNWFVAPAYSAPYLTLWQTWVTVALWIHVKRSRVDWVGYQVAEKQHGRRFATQSMGYSDVANLLTYVIGDSMMLAFGLVLKVYFGEITIF